MQKLAAALIVERLKDQIRTALADVLGAKERFALIDFPDYSNVGDSAIWLGELAYFRDVHGREPSFVAKNRMDDLNDLERFAPDGPIFIQGGGNFGDIWPDHQTFREAILDRFPERRVIQLPQSIHFADRQAAERTAQAIARHGDFVLFVRDHKSLAFATNAFACPVHLCPDMAFYMGPLERPAAPVKDIVCLMRQDKEAVSDTPLSVPTDMAGWIEIVDWLEEDRQALENPDVVARVRDKVARRLGLGSPAVLRERYFRNRAERRLERGLALLARGRYLITDRLHAHILATLMGMPHTALDNSYGKLGGFIDAWTTDLDGLSRAKTMDEALRGATHTRSDGPA